MVPAFNPMSCPNLAVPAEVMQHIAQVESGTNPFAIGVVGARLERQPRSLDEAVATARMLESKGYDYSLGIAQVNRRNLVRFGLGSFSKAFDGCANLSAGARILAACYERSGGNWGKAFSCYYSGDFVTGYRDGYVQRVYGAINADAADGPAPITVHPWTRERPGEARAAAQQPVKAGRAYLVAMRSVALDSATGALVSGTEQTTASPAGGKPAAIRQPVPEAAGPRAPDSRSDSVFVPRVSGPNDAPAVAVAAGAPTLSGNSSTSVAVTPAVPPDQDVSDAAFVF